MNIDIKILALCLTFCLASSLITSMVFLSAIETKVEKVDKRLVEIDGRRNAQYGILKREIEGQ